MSRRRQVFGICLLAILTGLSAPADELAEKGRAVLRQNQRAIVTVQLVVKNKLAMGGMGAKSSEMRQEVTGTILDPSGLTVMSLSGTDPAQLIQNVMGGLGNEESKLKVETEISDVKLLLHDGTQMAAEVIHRDPGLDLAFVRPKEKPGSPLQAVDLSKPGKAQVLDQVIALNRLGSVVERAFAASVERISAVVESPQSFYVPEASMTTTPLGAPAFTADGGILGFFAMRAAKAQPPAAGPGAVSKGDKVAGIIVPAAEVLKAVKKLPPADQPKP